MYHLIFFGAGLGMVIYGIYANTKSQIHLRKQMLKKYVGIYLMLVIIWDLGIIPLFSLIKSLTN